MNKYLKYFYSCIICLSVFVVFLTTFASSCSKETANQWINRKIQITLPFKINSKNIIKQDREWFIAVQLTKEQTKKIFDDKFDKFGFTGWRLFKKNRSFGVKEKYSVNERDNVFVNYKESDGNYKLDPPWNSIALYLDIKKDILIFHWGITYGI